MGAKKKYFEKNFLYPNPGYALSSMMDKQQQQFVLSG